MHFLTLFSLNNLLNALFEPYSLIVLIKVAKNIAINIPSVSNQLSSANKNTNLIASTIKSILIIGSPKDSNNNLKNVFLFLTTTSLLPYFSLLLTTSSLLSPVIISSN